MPSRVASCQYRDAIVTSTFDIVARAPSGHNARTNVVLPEAVRRAVTAMLRASFSAMFSLNFADFPPNFFAMGALPAQEAGLRY
jgi:hypothetical protein